MIEVADTVIQPCCYAIWRRVKENDRTLVLLYPFRNALHGVILTTMVIHFEDALVTNGTVMSTGRFGRDALLANGCDFFEDGLFRRVTG